MVKFKPKFFCEAEKCADRAEDEWKYIDEDGCVYYTMRCEKHPVTDPTYKKIDLLTGQELIHE